MKKYGDFAPYYDFLSKGVPGDLKFYAHLAKKAKGHVLEIGCGTGRILLPLLQQEINVSGLDNSVEMLEVLKAKAKRQGLTPQLYLANMQDFKINEKFDLIFVPYRVFLHNLTVEDQLKTLACIKRHLKKNGVLALNFFYPNPAYMVARNGKLVKNTKPAYTDEKGRKIYLHEKIEYDFPNQQLYATWKLMRKTGSKLALEKTLEIHLAYIYPKQFELLLRLAGFKKWKVYGGFKGEKLERKEQETVWIINA
ncbi:class I SAM-dependent methyltransferase [Candidatus Micrarchaeota archaeon]|nr:class I SAM-dependent methyltransferase [Candidatus Micrarchaeota archaeon]